MDNFKNKQELTHTETHLKQIQVSVLGNLRNHTGNHRTIAAYPRALKVYKNMVHFETHPNMNPLSVFEKRTKFTENPESFLEIW